MRSWKSVGFLRLTKHSHSFTEGNKNRISKLRKKEDLKIVLFVVTFIISSAIFSDWEHFKDGLFGLN